MQDRLRKTLKDVFGFSDFRPLQAEIMANIMARKDTLVIMPTGGGKSLCYQLPALIFPGLTLVISPLISLMKDQVDQLRELGVAALMLNSSLPPDVYRENCARLRAGQAKLLYLAPETLLKPSTLNLLAELKVDCLTIDEAHCISEWGHDFRPEYRKLAKVRKRFPQAVCVALTATATPRVRQDIAESLHFEAGNEFIAGFDRPNLLLEVVPKQDPLSDTLRFLKDRKQQSGIIYCFSRKQVDELTLDLQAHGFATRPYHAGLPDATRRKNQEAFIRDNVQIIVATIAFGMGINKPDIRFVIHYDLPKNIEGYYQEIGRAGRDGLPAHCRLYFSYGDTQKIRYFIDQKEEAERRVASLHLQAMLRYAETEMCRRKPLISYFGEHYDKEHCGQCDNCLREDRERADLSIAAQKFLSCVKRTRERFGAQHIIDVLRGSEAKKVLDFRHHELTTWGIGKEYSKKQWQQLARQFIHNGLLQQDLDYGSLRITPKGYDVLLGREKTFGVLEEQAADIHAAPQAEQDYNRELYDILRKLRKRLADRTGLAPYMVFPDKSLMEMAAFYPQSPQSLLAIHGVGGAKFKTFGKVFLATICEFAGQHGLADLKQQQPAPRQRAGGSAKSGGGGKRRQEILAAHLAGKRAQELVREFNISYDTVFQHLWACAREGTKLRPDILRPDWGESEDGMIKEALHYFDKFGLDRLKPVYEEMGSYFMYEDLKELRCYAAALKNPAD